MAEHLEHALSVTREVVGLDTVPSTDVELLTDVAAALRRTAALLEGDATSHDATRDLRSLDASVLATRERARAAVVVAVQDGGDPMAPADAVAPVLTLAHIVLWIEYEAARVADPAGLPMPSVTTAPEIRNVAGSGVRQLTRRTGRFVRAELDPEGVILKNSIRAGAALGAAIALAEVLPLEHGFWVALGALSILRSSASSTYACARQAIVGTVIGFIVAAIVALTVGDNEAVLWIILPIVTFLAGYTPGAMHFAAGQAAFTVLVVVLFGLLGSPDLETDVLRIETISVGAFTAVALSLVIWPRGARVAIARTVAQVYRLAGAAASTFVTGDNDARAEAELDLSDALRRAEAAFGAALAEHSEPLDPAAWVTVMQPAIVTRALTLGLLPSVEHATTRDHARACPTHNDERPVCRLFGMTAGSRPVSATFWLLDAPDSLESQGRRNRDGTGLGYFTTSGRPVVDKQPEPAYSDVEFIRDARVEASTTFVAHVRVATASSLRVENTHPFEMEGRIMAHNGGFEQIELVEAELGPDLARVQGDTDSERYFALITKRIAERDGDVSAGVADAVRWLAENVPLYSLNLVLATENQLWALRYPEHHHLYVLRRPLIDPHGRTFRAVSPTMRVAATELGMGETVVVASEPMDEKSDWRLMDPGELMHVSADLEVDSQIVISEPPALRSVDPLPYVP